MYLFGSKLIKKIFPDFREPNDEDWITNNKDELKKSIVGKQEYYYIPFSPDREMTADEIYTVKVSHAIYDIHWRKTMSDIRFLQIKGCQVIPELLSQLRKHWETIHGPQKRVDFEVEEGKFFDDRVKRKVNHDDLHKMLNPTPTYLKMIVNDVNPDEDKFFALPLNDQKEVLFEEAFVIALERFSKQNNRLSYNTAQQSLVTRLHPIWIADYIILNWNKWYWNPTISKYYENFLTLKEDN